MKSIRKFTDDLLKIALTMCGLFLIGSVIYFLFTAEFTRAIGSFIALIFVAFLLHEDKK